MKIRWTEKEDEILRQLWGKVLIDEIMKVLTQRTKPAVQQRATGLKLGEAKTEEPTIDFEYLKKLQETIEI